MSDQLVCQGNGVAFIPSVDAGDDHALFSAAAKAIHLDRPVLYRPSDDDQPIDRDRSQGWQWCWGNARSRRQDNRWAGLDRR